MEKNKLDFEVAGLKLSVKRPNFKQKKQGELVYAKAFKEALKNGAILKASLYDYLKEQGLVSVEKQASLLSLLNKVETNVKKLDNPELKEDEGADLASEIKLDRLTIQSILSVEWSVNQNTAESMADNERFNYFVSVCTYKEDGKPYFNSVDHYYEEAESEIGIKSATKLSNLLYDVEENYEKNLPENLYLEKIKPKTE